MSEVQDRPPTWLELESVKPLRPDCEAITSLSIDSLNRHYSEFIIELSPRRRGMRLRDALKIAKGAHAP
jgi:hypothetical protein